MKHSIHALLIISTFVFSVGSNAEEAESIKWTVTPYLWASKTDVSMKVIDQEVGQGELSFSDLIDKLDGTAMLHVEGGKGDWSFYSDLTYLSTSGTERVTVPVTMTQLDVDGDNKQLFVDLAGVYWPHGVDSNLSIVTGVRYTKFDTDFTFLQDGVAISRQENDRDYWDVLIGLRYRLALAEQWSLLLSGDSSFGKSEGSTLLRTFFTWETGAGRSDQVILGYQYRQAEYGSGLLQIDFNYQGPVVGYSFRF